jgi:hypothetical protein
MPQLPGQGLLAWLLGLVHIAQLPQGSYKPGEADDPGMKPSGEERAGGLLGSGTLQALLRVCTGRDEVAQIEREASNERVGLSCKDRMVGSCAAADLRTPIMTSELDASGLSTVFGW